MPTPPHFGVHEILWDGSEWQLLDNVSGNELYDSPDAVDYPWLAVWTLGTTGVTPAPTVIAGAVQQAGAEELTLGSASYNATTGILSVPIN